MSTIADNFQIAIGTEDDFAVSKHASAIRIANKMSLAERRIWNVLLFRCYDKLLEQEIHALPIRELAFDVGCTPNNIKWLSDSFRALNRLEIEWDVIQAGKRRWGVTTALAHAEIIDGRNCEWSYPAPLRRALYKPDIYGRLNLHVQKNFRRAHALALWEFFHLQLGGRTQATFRLTVAEYCSLLSVSDHYRDTFKLLSRKAIKPVLAEIASKSDIAAQVQYIRDGRGGVQALEFDISMRTIDPPLGNHIDADPLIRRMVDCFGLGPDDACSFKTKYQNDEPWLLELLDDVQRRFAAGKIPRSRIPAYTRATLDRASARPPQIDSIAHTREPERLRPVEPPPKDAAHERGLARFEQMTEVERVGALEAWIGTPGARPFVEIYNQHGLRSPLAKAAFHQWLGSASDSIV